MPAQAENGPFLPIVRRSTNGGFRPIYANTEISPMSARGTAGNRVIGISGECSPGAECSSKRAEVSPCARLKLLSLSSLLLGSSIQLVRKIRAVVVWQLGR